MPRDTISRRGFVSSAATAASVFTIVPRHVLGRGFRAPSDTLNVACIGVGGMGRTDLRGMGGENIYAMCDVDSNNLGSAFSEFPGAKRFRDYREMFDREAPNIDAVTVSIPDHSHVAAAMLAMNAGKHTYVQKPLARTIGEVTRLKEAARQSGVTTQMGNQGHANEGTRQIREWVEAGAIGTVREVHYWTNRPIWPQGMDRPLELYNVPAHFDWNLWLGPASERPYHTAYAHFNWRGWWDFGTGALGDIACHAMDAAFWTLQLGYPDRIEAESTKVFLETAPKASRIVYDFPANGDRAAVKVVWRDGGFVPPLPEEVVDDPTWSFEGIGGQLWVGEDGKLFAGVYGEDPRLLDKQRHEDLIASPPAEKYARTEGVYAEWIDACKAGTKAGSDFAEHAGPLTEMVLLGNLALRTGQALELDANTGRVTNVDVPSEYTDPVYRTGWSL